MLQAAHPQLPGGEVVLVWDNLGVHHPAAMRAFIDAHTGWLTVFHRRPTPPSSTRPRQCGRC